jgi:hypothetical protein
MGERARKLIEYGRAFEEAISACCVYELNTIDDEEYWSLGPEERKRALSTMPICKERVKSFIGDWVPDNRVNAVLEIIDSIGVSRLAYFERRPTNSGGSLIGLSN